MRCTGECCRVFVLSNDVETFVRVDQLPDDLRRLFVLQDVVPETPERVAHARFGCSAWDSTSRRCMAYDSRPSLCVRYPEAQHCHHCGAQSSAEARGVALVRSPVAKRQGT